MAGELYTPTDTDGLIQPRPTPHFSEMFPNEINPHYEGVSLMDEVFARDEEGNLNQHLVGSFFKEAVEIYKNNHVPQPIRDELYSMITPTLLDEIADESNLNRWDAQNVEAALHAYTTFQDLERKYGPEAATSLNRQIAQEIIVGRVVDEALERVGEETTREGRGVTIYLGTRGAEVAQTVAKIAYRNTSKALGSKTVFNLYYRDHLLALNPFDESYDPEGELLTIDESMADLARVEGSARGKVELNVKAKVKNGRIPVFSSTPNVGGHIVAGSGYALRARRNGFVNEKIEYDQPARADEQRRYQLEHIEETVLTSLGDGAYPEMQKALEPAAAYRVPEIFFVQNNGVAIGVESNESVFIDEYWQKGHGIGIPGVRSELTDIDGLYLAMEFATKRAVYDAGPTIVEAMTVRLLPHSSQHGDHLASEYLGMVKHAFNEYSSQFPEDDLRRVQLNHLYNQDVVKPAQTDNQIKLKDRLTTLISSKKLSPDLTTKIIQIRDSIVDPVAEVLSTIADKEYADEAEYDTWQQEAKKRVTAIQEEVMSRPRFEPEDALQHVRMETPSVSQIREVRDLAYSTEKLRLNGAEAMRLALSEAMAENPNIHVWGTDVFKGVSIDRGLGNTLRETWQGGYFKQEDNLFRDFGHQPFRVMNTPIAENDVAKLAYGFVTTPTDEASLANAARGVVDFQYADYGIQSWEAHHVLGDVLWSTSGQLARPVTFVLPGGAVAGGGPRHGDEVADIAISMNAGIDVIYAADEESIYKGLKYNALYNNNPTIFNIDKKIFGRADKDKMEFEKGFGLFEPGRARTIKEGYGELQIISYGPMVNTIRQALTTIEDRNILDQVSVLDIYSLRPFPEDDVLEFLRQGSKFGTILFAHEEPKRQGFGNNHAKSIIWDAESPYWNLVRRRKPVTEAGADIPGVPTDGPQMKLTVPQYERIADRIRQFTRK